MYVDSRRCLLALAVLAVISAATLAQTAPPVAAPAATPSATPAAPPAPELPAVGAPHAAYPPTAYPPTAPPAGAAPAVAPVPVPPAAGMVAYPQIANGSFVLSPYHAGWAHSPEAAEAAQKFAELDAKSQDLARQIQVLAGEDAPEEEKAKRREDLRTQLEDTVRQAFEARLKVQQVEVDQLKERLAKVEQTLQKRQSRRDDIVESRIAELLNENQELQWNPNGPTGRVSTTVVHGRYYPTDAGGLKQIPANVTPAPAAAPRATATPSGAAARYGASGTPAQAPPPVTWTPSTPSRGGPFATAGGLALGPTSLGQQESLLPHLAETRKALIDTEFALLKAERQLQQVTDLQANRAVSASEVEQAKRELEQARRHADRVRREYESQLRLLEINVQSAQARLKEAESNVQRVQALREDNAISQTEVDARQAALDQAKSELEYVMTLLALHRRAAQADEEPAERVKQ